ncbi:MAG: hypothetical protein WA117_12090 [Verrucomicrobiia bacterium]
MNTISLMTPSGAVTIDLDLYPEVKKLFTADDLGPASALPNVNSAPETNEGGEFLLEQAQTPEQFFDATKNLLLM